MALYQALERMGRKFERVIDKVKNGECRIMAANTDGTADAQGFPDPFFTARTDGYIPCVWEERNAGTSNADEANIGAQTTGIIKYKISIPRFFDGAAVEINTADRLELKQTVGGSVSATFEIVGPVNVSNVIWEVYATDIAAP